MRCFFQKWAFRPPFFRCTGGFRGLRIQAAASPDAGTVLSCRKPCNPLAAAGEKQRAASAAPAIEREKTAYRKSVRASWWRGRFPLRAAATIHSGGKPSAGFPAAPGRSNHTRSPEDLLTGGWINWSDSILF